MEGKQNVWDPWYLMTLDKLGKLECKFCNMVISYYKDVIFFHLGYQPDGNGHIGVDICPKTQAQVKPLFANFGGILFITIR